MSLQEFWQCNRGKAVCYTKVRGDCMEGFGREAGLSGICDGDIVRVDFGKMPLPPRCEKVDGYEHADACLCYGSIHDGPAEMMIKAYSGVWGWMQQVSTRYKQKPDTGYRMNYAFEPRAILGVVSACYDPDGALKWERDVSKYPEELGTENTMLGPAPVRFKTMEK